MLVVFFCFGIYLSSFRAPFLFDDQINITRNPYIRVTEPSLSQLKRAAVQDRFQMRFLSNLLFGLDYYFHGLNPRWMHAENILLHALTAVLLLLLAERMIEIVSPSEALRRQRRPVAFLAALFWAAHPAHTQAVTYLVQRQTVLAAAGILASFLAFLNARTAAGQKRRYLFYGLSVAAFAAAAGSKEIGWTAPVYWILFELLFLLPRAPGRKATLLAAVLLLAVATAGALWFLLRSNLLVSYLAYYQELDYGPAARLLTEARVVLSYVRDIFLPRLSALALDQEVTVSRSPFSPWTTFPALAVTGGILAAAVACRRRHPMFAFLILGFFAALAPESTLLPVDLRNDHRMYLASLFLLPPAVVLAGRREPRRAFIFFPFLILLMGILAFLRNQTWTSETAVWRDAVRKSPNLPRPWNNLCRARILSREYLQAAAACDRAIALAPQKAEPWLNKGTALVNLGRDQEAGEIFAETAKKYPADGQAQFNYAAFLEKQGRREEAVSYYRRSLAADPFHQEARLRLARNLRFIGRETEAMEEIKLLSRLFPDSTRAWLELARAAIWSRELQTAVNAAQRALKSAPEETEAYLLLGTAELLAGRYAEAETAFAGALRLEPQNPRAWIGLARTALAAGDRAKARAAMDAARRAGPLSPEAEEELHALQAELAGHGPGP